MTRKACCLSRVLVTFPTRTQLIYSIQSHSRLIQPPVTVLPSFSLPDTILSSPPLDDNYCQVCQSPFDEHQMLLCDIYNAGWHMDYFLLPLTSIPHGTWKCPLCTPHYLLLHTVTRHLRLQVPFRFRVWLKYNKDDSLSNCAFGLPITIYSPNMYLQTLPPEFWPQIHMHAYHKGSGFETQVSFAISSPFSEIGHQLFNFFEIRHPFFSPFFEIGLHVPTFCSDFFNIQKFLTSDVSWIWNQKSDLKTRRCPISKTLEKVEVKRAG